MNPALAAVLYSVLILGLFWLDRDRKVRTSPALLIPIAWLLIVGSRPVSEWMNAGTEVFLTQNLEGSPLDASVFGFLVAAGLVVLIKRKKKVMPFLRANAPIILFFVYCALSTIWADNTFVALKRWIKAIGDLTMILVVLTDANPLAAMKRFLTHTGFLLIPLSILFIKYFPVIGRSYNPWTWEPMYGGVTEFKNLLGMTCLVCGLGSVWCCADAVRQRKGQDMWRHMAPHAIVALMAVSLFFTADSKTSLSCFMMGSALIVVPTLSRSMRRPEMMHLLAFGAVGLSLVALFLPSSGLVESLGRDATLTGRTNIWAAALSQVTNPMLGAGFESFWTGTRLERIWVLIKEPGIQEAHNGYIEVFLNLGWVGVALLSSIIVAGYASASKLVRRDSPAGIIRVALCVVGVIYSCTEAGFRMMSVSWISFLLASTALPRVKVKKTAEATSNRSTELVPAEVPAHAKCF